MFEIKTLLVLIPALPLAAFVVTAALGKKVLRQRSHVPLVAALAAAFLASLGLLAQVYRQSQQAPDAGPAPGHESAAYEKIVPLWTWAVVGNAYTAGEGKLLAGPAESRDFRIEVVLRADPLTAVMLVVVTLVSLLVAVYSIGYMHGDPGYWRFFTYIALFVFSMTMLVSVSNFVLLYVFWEAVGLCSYLLIGFWFQKPEAAAAGKKAFLVNRVGDSGFALGVFLIWITYGTLNFHDVKVAPDPRAPERTVVYHDPADVQNANLAGTQFGGVLGRTTLDNMAEHPRLYHGAALVAICLLLMLGACGKSAQLPLHVWLPDAMEGPTPVSALIHAATMVTAGVYMVARCAPLFAASPQARQVVAVIGGATALMAAIVAVTQTDLKRILAYSTISQLGYMFLAMGTGTLLGVAAGMFHLVTHAFFKALLFLGAGSVMHATGGVIDIRRLGGLRRVMPVTCATFLVGALGLAGIVPLAGFWSKDAILQAVRQEGTAGSGSTLYAALYVAALFTALLTAFYTFRAFFLTFYGPTRIPPEAGRHAHESPRVMTVPLVVLAVGTVVVGALLEWNRVLERFLARTPSISFLEGAAHAAHSEPGFDWSIAAASTLVAVAGIGLAGALYLAMPALLEQLTATMKAVGLYALSAGKFFFDPIYSLLIVRPLEGLARLSAWADRVAIDGLVDRIGGLPPALGSALRPFQPGLIPFYALAMLLGLLVLLGTMLI